MNIPTAHVEGGDITEGGALDDSVRHAMSKLAHLHFTTNEQATNRILAMGEDPWRVKTVGFPAIDLIQDGSYETPENIIKKLNINLNKPIVLFTQHSVTTEFEDGEYQLTHSLDALIQLANEGVQIILTYPNNDAGGQSIAKVLNKTSELNNENIQLHTSLGRYLYHGILALARNSNLRIACVGNSSSGIKETPVFGCPTVNIGTRQQGRLRGTNVIDADYQQKEIYEAIKKCLYDDNFRHICKNTINPYGGGNAGQLIADSLAKVDLSPKNILRKGMSLIGENVNGWFR
jgi:UDP-N-acetylglucosamine 2-epimerase (non-hydrolysing)/GDP/UDP-N,N'-diacetylbacillosamine 2-epimerase (hydrolysing)